MLIRIIIILNAVGIIKWTQNRNKIRKWKGKRRSWVTGICKQSSQRKSLKWNIINKNYSSRSVYSLYFILR